MSMNVENRAWKNTEKEISQNANRSSGLYFLV